MVTMLPEGDTKAKEEAKIDEKKRTVDAELAAAAEVTSKAQRGEQEAARVAERLSVPDVPNAKPIEPPRSIETEDTVKTEEKNEEAKKAVREAEEDMQARATELMEEKARVAAINDPAEKIVATRLLEVNRFLSCAFFFLNAA